MHATIFSLHGNLTWEEERGLVLETRVHDREMFMLIVLWINKIPTQSFNCIFFDHMTPTPIPLRVASVARDFASGMAAHLISFGHHPRSVPELLLEGAPLGTDHTLVLFLLWWLSMCVLLCLM